MNSDSLPYPYGSPAISGTIKSRAEDFRVDEELAFEPTGEGEHLLLQIEKRGLSTPELVSRLSSDYGLHPRQIGFSGLKDKNALTTQWLSLHLPGKQDPAARRQSEDYRVLRASRHRAKLRRGTHRSNLFRIRIRKVTDLPDCSVKQLDALAEHGMANYFGAQRFGRQGDNVEQALQKLAKPRLKRQLKSLLISALRSELFNRVLAERIRMDFWRRPLDGDVFMLRGSRSIFSEPPDAALTRRFDSLDISSTASLYGAGHSLLGGEALAIERRVFAANPDIVACLERERTSLQMRPLRVAVEALEYRLDSRKQVLELQLRLPAGSYLTSLLGHFICATEEDQAVLR